MLAYSNPITYFSVHVDGIGVFRGMTMFFDTKYVFIFLPC